MIYEVRNRTTFRISCCPVVSPYIRGEIYIAVDGSEKTLCFPLLSPVPLVCHRDPTVKMADDCIFDILEEWRSVPQRDDRLLWVLYETLLKKRDEFRQQKNFQMADWIRDVIKEAGLEVRDTISIKDEEK